MKKILFASALIAFLSLGFHFYLKDARAKARAPAACLFIGQAAREWNDAYKDHKRDLPSAYPQSLEQLTAYDFIPSSMMEDFQKLMRIEIFPPSSEPSLDYIFVKTYIRGHTFAGNIGGATSEITNTAEQGAAANP